MAPVKPMGTEGNPLRQGIGFPQKYNQEAPPAADLNPAAVTDQSVLPKPRAVSAPKVAKAPSQSAGKKR